MRPTEQSATENRHELQSSALEEASLVAIPTVDDDVPDGGYGYVIVPCIYMLNAFTWGVVASYGVFLSYYLENQTFPNGTSLDYALIGGLQFGFTLLATTPVNWLTRRFDVQVPMFIGIILQTGGFVAASFAKDNIYQLYLSQGICIGLGLGFTWLPSINIIAQWFRKKRSLANGITSSGSGMGGILFSFITRAALSNLGLAWTLRTVGIVSGGVNTIATCLIRSRNKSVQPHFHPFNVKMLKKTNVLLLLAWAFVVQFGYVTIYFSLPDFAASIGLTPHQGAVVNAVLNVGTAVGRPALGWLSDRYGRIEIAVWTTLFNAIAAFAIWIPTNSYRVLLFFAFVEGIGVGLFWPSIGPLCGEVVGLKDLPELLSISWATVLLPLVFSEVIALYLRRPGPSYPYLYAQIFTGLSYLIAFVFLAGLWHYQRRLKRRG